MSKIGDGIHSTDDGARIFIAPDVQRFPTRDGGEVIVVDEPVSPEQDTDD